MKETLATDIMRPKEVAEYLRLSYRTVLYMIQAGDIPASRIGGRYLVTKGDLLKTMEDNRVQKAPNLY